MSVRDLRVVDDLVDAAVELFLETTPRTIALSGGSTPKPVYERLAQTPYPWRDVDAFFGDERCVPSDHPDSNFRMANEALLAKVPARSHPMSECDPDAYRAELQDVFGSGVPLFDLVFLGLGDDGHTASLFPGDPALDVTGEPVVRVEHPGMPPEHPRLTLTLPVLNAAKLSLFLVAGRSKREPLRRLMEGDQRVPAARVRSDAVIVLADREAAGDPAGD
ncbi:MAG: 6-phosphogluconolactonase [Actinomycetota bacterium]